jgi:phosphoribosyl-ATP pyrophosphohydrolase/phosphoribosyl-AMP cyclohydrolase
MELKELLALADFDKESGLIPAVIQDYSTLKVLMLGYMDEAALKQTFETKKVTFYSRSKNRIWVKGETSGNFIAFKSAKLDCDNDTLLIKARPVGPVCHTGTATCWNEKNTGAKSFLYKLEQIVNKRKLEPLPDSYTSKLLAQGVNKIAKKVGEEAVEVVIEAKDNDPKLFLSEMADLMYHLTVLLAKKEVSWKEVEKALEKRRR